MADVTTPGPLRAEMFPEAGNRKWKDLLLGEGAGAASWLWSRMQEGSSCKGQCPRLFRHLQMVRHELETGNWCGKKSHSYKMLITSSPTSCNLFLNKQPIGLSASTPSPFTAICSIRFYAVDPQFWLPLFLWYHIHHAQPVCAWAHSTAKPAHRCALMQAVVRLFCLKLEEV